MKEGEKMGIIGNFIKNAMEEEREIVKARIQADMIAEEMAEEQMVRTTCKLCQMIFSEGYPYQRTFTGKPKNYICKNCAKKMGLI